MAATSTVSTNETPGKSSSSTFPPTAVPNDTWRCVRCGRSAGGGPGESAPCCRTFLHRCPPRVSSVRFQPAAGEAASTKKNSCGSVLRLPKIQVGTSFCLLKAIFCCKKKIFEKSCVHTHQIWWKISSLRARPPIGWIASTKSSTSYCTRNGTTIHCFSRKEQHMNQPGGPELKNSNKHQQAIKKQPEIPQTITWDVEWHVRIQTLSERTEDFEKIAPKWRLFSKAPKRTHHSNKK